MDNVFDNLAKTDVHDVDDTLYYGEEINYIKNKGNDNGFGGEVIKIFRGMKKDLKICSKLNMNQMN